MVSQLVTLRQVFLERQQKVREQVLSFFGPANTRNVQALILVIGEFSRSDLVSDINISDIEEPEPGQPNACAYTSIQSFWKPSARYVGKPWSVRAAQLVAAAVGAHLMIVDADIQLNHFELSGHSLVRTLIEPLAGILPPLADDCDVSPPPAAAVSLNAPRSYLSDDGIVHLFSSLFMHAVLGTHVHQPHGGEFSLSKDANIALLSDPALHYTDSYCVQMQALTHLLAKKGLVVVEKLMRGKWHAKIGLAKILKPSTANGKCRIDLVTERLFEDAMWLSAQGITSAAARVYVIASGKTHELAQDDEGGSYLCRWVESSRLLPRIHVSGGGSVTHAAAAPNSSAAAPREGYPGVYPDPNAQQMCVLAPPASRRELMAALRQFLREFLHVHLAHMPDCYFTQAALPVLHAACNAPRGVFRVVPSPQEGPSGDDPIVFGADAWAASTAALMRVYAESAAGSDTRRAVVSANRLSWLLGALAWVNVAARDDWGAAHERMEEYYAAFRRAFLSSRGDETRETRYDA